MVTDENKIIEEPEDTRATKEEVSTFYFILFFHKRRDM